MSTTVGTVIIDVKADTAKLVSGMDKAEKTVKRSVDNIKKSIISMAAAYTGLEGVKSATRGFIELENAQIGVQKTTGLAKEEFDKLTNTLDGMSVSLSGFDLIGLYDIAEAAGQLGIQGVENISEFTRVIGMVGLTTELTSKVAATSFAKLSNSLNEPISNIETLASVANELSNTTSATVGDLLKFSQRLSGGAKTAGLLTDEIFGLSATMVDLAINFETGGTNINKVMLDMIGDSDKFARAIGSDISTYASTVQDEPIVALQQLLEHMNSLSKTDAANFLTELGYSGTEVKDVLLKLSSNTELLTKNLKIAKDEYESATSISIEYEVASQSLEAQNYKLINSLKLLAADIGSGLKDPILETSEALTDLFQITRDNLSEVAMFGGSVAATAVGVKAYSPAVKLATTATMLFTGSFHTLDRSIIAATISTKAFSLATKAIPYVAVATAAYTLYEIVSNTADAYERQAGALEQMKKNSLGFTGLGVMEDHKYETAIDNLVVAFDTMENTEKAYMTVMGTQYEKYYKEVYDKAKTHYKDLEELAISESERIFFDPSALVTGAGTDKPKNKPKTPQKSSELTSDISMSLDAWKDYFITIGEYNNAWLIEEANLRDKFVNLNDEQFSTMAIGAKEKFYDGVGLLYADDVKAFEDNQNKKSNLQTQFLDVVTSDTDKINDKYMEMYEASEGLFSDDQMQTFFGKWNNELDGINDKNQANLGNQLDAYSSLAGSMSNMYEEGSNSAKNFALIQQGLAVASGVNAILTQASGDPYTAFARMAAMSISVVSLLSNIGQTISGGGSGSDSSGPSSYEINIQEINDANEPILDRLDRQIELLESIDGYGGTAVSTTLERAKLRFETDYSLAIESGFDNSSNNTYTEKDWSPGGLSSMGHYDEDGTIISIVEWNEGITDWFNELAGLENLLSYSYEDAGDYIYTYASLNEELLREGTNYIDTLTFLKELGEKEGYDYLEAFGYTKAEYASIINDLEQANHDYAMSLLDNIKTLTDASNDFKNAFDDITGTTTYKDQTLSDAKTDVGGLLSPGQSLEEYLVKYIDDIAAVESILTPDAIETMLAVESDLGFDAVAQQDLYNQVAAETGVILENGALEALNYKDSLLLVADSMAESNKNIDSWTQRNETVEETAQRLSNTLGVDLVQSTSELDTLATTLIASNGELTSAELDVLQANEAYLDSLGLVEEAVTSVAESEANIKSWNDSFKTSTELAQDMAKALDVDLATSMNNLNYLFENLANDADGLTSAELDLLNANKNLIESYSDLALGLENDIVSTIDGILGTLDSSLSDTNSLASYNDAMSKALSLQDSDDRDALYSSLLDVSKYSGALTDSSNFATSMDMEFAQAVAASQLSTIKTESEDQISLLSSVDDTLVDIFNELQTDDISTISIVDDAFSITTDYDSIVTQLIKSNELIEQQTKLIETQANEIRAMKKELIDQTILLTDIEENTA